MVMAERLAKLDSVTLWCGVTLTRGDIERFLVKIEDGALDACWRWTGGRTQGYGSFRASRRSMAAHIVAYELFRGRVPSGMVLDHTCHNGDAECGGGSACAHRSCVNPSHLEAVTRGENVARSLHTLRIDDYHRAITQCPSGHDYSGTNLHVKRSGARVCRACQRERMRRLYRS